MVIKFEIEHEVKPGHESRVLEMIKDLKRGNPDRKVNSLWQELMLAGSSLPEKNNGSLVTETGSLPVNWGALLNRPARVRMLLSS